MSRKDIMKGVLECELAKLIHSATAHGFIITVELRPQRPLAMGNYLMLGEVREKRPLADKRDIYAEIAKYNAETVPLDTQRRLREWDASHGAFTAPFGKLVAKAGDVPKDWE